MFKNRQVALEIRDLFVDVSDLVFRARRIVKNADCTEDERKEFEKRICLSFELPLADALAEIYTEHPDLARKEESHPEGYWEARKKKREERSKLE
jgi:hypothetical protein